MAPPAPDLQGLRLLDAIAACGSLTAAAARLGLGVPAASKRLAALERRFDVELVRRHSRGAALTSAGQALAARARTAFEALDALDREMAEHARGVRGRVSIVANASSITQFLPADIARFVAAWPDVRIELEERSSDEVARAVRSGDADLGVLESASRPADLPAQRYRSDRLVLVAAPAHPLAARRRIAFAEALGFDFVGLHDGTALRALMDRASRDAGRTVRVSVQVRSFDAVGRLVAAGAGVGLMPDPAAREYGAALRLRRVALADDWAQREHWIVTRGATRLAGPAKLFLRQIASTR